MNSIILELSRRVSAQAYRALVEGKSPKDTATVGIELLNEAVEKGEHLTPFEVMQVSLALGRVGYYASMAGETYVDE